MAASRLELNLMRLLSRCEALAAERRDPEEWRLEKYVAALEDMLRELKKQASGSKSKFLVLMLSILGTAFPMTFKSQMYFHLGEVSAGRNLNVMTSADLTVLVLSELRSLGRPWEINPQGSSDANFYFTLSFCRGLASDEKQSAVELDAVLQHHQDMQEKLAEEMLSLARSLKNNTLAAQNVIKQDNQTLSHSLRMADQNFEKLKDESDRLEQHAKKSVNWLLWIMLIVVCFIFISMILFIRIFPKLK
ncbi:USE1 protein, partial [Fregetta grallaria]|nr:USE1 protein [Fregetta grallaria]